MKTILATILFLALSAGAAYSQTVYDIELATLSWQHVWVQDDQWINQRKTFPFSVINCNRDFTNVVNFQVAGPTLNAPFLDFIKVPGDYTCDITIVHNSGNETAPSPTVTFTASRPEPLATDLEIIVLQ